MRDIDTVAFDGDNTLWHNEPLFWATKERFAELLAPWSEPDRLAERVAAVGRANLALFGYGIKGFALSLIETAIEVSDSRVPAAVIHEIVARAKDMLAHPVHLLDGAREAVEACAGLRRVLITKGDLLDQESKVARSGLAELFDAVEVVSEKDAGTYRRVLARLGAKPERTVMVGDSVRSDILPMVEAGGWAVHVPYPLVWEHERADPPEGHPRFTRIASLSEFPAYLGRACD
ncbi:MAG: HAD family hydrolase [Pseudomonadota bacterium]